MAKFNFAMESLLRVRERVEEQKRQEFGKAMAALEIEKAKLEDLSETKRSSVLNFKKNILKSIEPEKSTLYNNFIELVKSRITKQKVIVKKTEDFVEVKRKELLAATVEKKKLEKLKERKYDEYIIDEKHIEQSITDEIVTYRYND